MKTRLLLCPLCEPTTSFEYQGNLFAFSTTKLSIRGVGGGNDLNRECVSQSIKHEVCCHNAGTRGAIMVHVLMALFYVSAGT